MNENPQKFNPLEGPGVTENGKPLTPEKSSNSENFNPIPTDQELVDRREIVLDPLEQAKRIAKNEQQIAETKAKLNAFFDNAVVSENNKSNFDNPIVSEDGKPIESTPEMEVPKPPKKFDLMDGATENGNPIIKEKFDPMDGAMENGKNL